VAFIEDVGGASTFNAASTWKEQAASNPGVNSATRNVYAMNSNGTGLKKLNDQPFDFHSVYMLPDGSKKVFAGHAADGYSQIYFVQLGGKSFQRGAPLLRLRHRCETDVAHPRRKLHDLPSCIAETWPVAALRSRRSRAVARYKSGHFPGMPIHTL